MAGTDRGGRSRRHGRLQGLLQERPSAGNTQRGGGDDVLVRCRRRPSRERHDRRLVHPRGLSPHRAQRHRRPRRLHRAPRRALDLRRHRPRLRRRARRPGDGRGLRVRRLRVHLPGRAAVPDRRGRHALDLRDPRHVPDPALHPGDGAPPAPAGRAERAGVHRVARVRHPGARGDRADPSRPRRAGRVHERGRCDGDHLGVDRLGARSGGARPADRTDHPERAVPIGFARPPGAAVRPGRPR